MGPEFATAFKIGMVKTGLGVCVCPRNPLPQKVNFVYIGVWWWPSFRLASYSRREMDFFLHSMRGRSVLAGDDTLRREYYPRPQRQHPLKGPFALAGNRGKPNTKSKARAWYLASLCLV